MKANEIKAGDRFGRLTVIEREEKTGGRAYYFCRCDCGNEKIVLGRALVSGNTKSCGCLRKDLDAARASTSPVQIGSRFGRLTVIAFEGRNENSNKRWRCRCDCGNEITVYESALRAGKTSSCGCLRKETSREQCAALRQEQLAEKYGQEPIITKKELAALEKELKELRAERDGLREQLEKEKKRPLLRPLYSVPRWAARGNDSTLRFYRSEPSETPDGNFIGLGRDSFTLFGDNSPLPELRGKKQVYLAVLEQEDVCPMGE